MKAVVDDKIPFIKGVLEPYFEVIYLPGKEIRKEEILDADALIVRTRTACNAELLEGTGVRFIGTATIGFDHIDTNWCEQNGITWTNAPGCNSGSVAQYITAALIELADQQHFKLCDKTLGIIGVGHVGSKVDKIARALGIRILLNDPPRARKEGEKGFVELNELLAQSDIVTIHVPLNREGPDKTMNLVDQGFLQKLKPGSTLINTSRGEVVDEEAVISSIAYHLSSIVLDVWHNEPDINRKLLNLATIATPHIAGYSLDGKWNGTRMVIEKLFQFFKVDIEFANMENNPTGPRFRGDDLLASPDDKHLWTIFRATYDILADDRRLRESPETFEEQRGNYPVRREYGAWRIEPFPEGEIGRMLKEIGFVDLLIC